MAQLVLEITYWYAAIKTPYCKTVSEQMGVYAMSILAGLVLTFDLLQTCSGGYAIEKVLNLP
jgi:hypothetical protein